MCPVPLSCTTAEQGVRLQSILLMQRQGLLHGHATPFSLTAGFKTFNLKIFIGLSNWQTLGFCPSCSKPQSFVGKAVLLRNTWPTFVLDVLNTLTDMYKNASLLRGKAVIVLASQWGKENPSTWPSLEGTPSAEKRLQITLSRPYINAVTRASSCAAWCWQLSACCTELQIITDLNIFTYFNFNLLTKLN